MKRKAQVTFGHERSFDADTFMCLPLRTGAAINCPVDAFRVERRRLVRWPVPKRFGAILADGVVIVPEDRLCEAPKGYALRLAASTLAGRKSEAL